MDDLEQVRLAISAGDVQKARSILRPLLQQNDAEAWYLAARVATSREQSIQFLKRCLDLDPFHEAAQAGLERMKPQAPEPHAAPDVAFVPPNTQQLSKVPRRSRRSRSPRERQPSRYLGCQSCAQIVIVFFCVLICAFIYFATDGFTTPIEVDRGTAAGALGHAREVITDLAIVAGWTDIEFCTLDDSTVVYTLNWMITSCIAGKSSDSVVAGAIWLAEVRYRNGEYEVIDIEIVE